MKTESQERIHIEWYPGDGESSTEVQADADRLRNADATAEINVVASKGILPIPVFILAAIGVVAFAREITDLLCRLRKPGMLVDARGRGALKIKKTSELPGGTLIVIAKDGNPTQYNVCDGKVDLADLLRSAARGASAEAS
jgi:hypothetical protein